MTKIFHAMTTRVSSPPLRKLILASLVVAIAGSTPLHAAFGDDDLYDARARLQNQKKKIKPSDKSGFFIGAQLMYGNFLYNENHTYKTIQVLPAQNGVGDPISHKDSGIGYGLVAGYNHWFSRFIGIKVYNGVFYNDFTFESKEISYAPNGSANKTFAIAGGKNIKTYQIIFNANIDIMVNFFFRNNFTAGLFTGASAGLRYWNSPRLEELLGVYGDLGNTTSYIKNNQRLDDSRFGLDMAITAGLRANAYGFQTWELGVRVPIYDRPVLDGETVVGFQVGASHSMANVIKSRQTWNIFLRYMFNF